MQWVFHFPTVKCLPMIVIIDWDMSRLVLWLLSYLGIVRSVSQVKYQWLTRRISVPISQVSLKSLPALLAGNCVIIKPSPFSPYTALKVVEIAQQVLPPGVLQVLAGDDNLGPWLVDHEGIDKISFTGSCATGKKVMANAARTLKRVTLELWVVIIFLVSLS